MATKTIKVAGKGIKKEGSSAKGPWRIVGVKDEEGTWYYGFDNKFADFDALQPGMELQISYQWNDQYKQNDLNSTEVLIDIKSDQIPWNGPTPPPHLIQGYGGGSSGTQTITGEAPPSVQSRDAMKGCLWEALDEVDEIVKAIEQRFPSTNPEFGSAILEAVQRVAVSKYIQKSRG